MLAFAESLADTMFGFTKLIMYFAPIGVGAAVAYTVGHLGVGVLVNLLKLLATFYVAVAVFIGVVLLPVALIARVPLRRFAAAVVEPVSIAFATTSSEAALPRAMEAMEKLGVPRQIVAFVMPTGYSFNLDGSTLYLSLTAIFVAQAAGVDLSIGQQFLLLLTLMLTSKGVVSRGALVILLGTVGSFRPADRNRCSDPRHRRNPDMLRTSVSVLGTAWRRWWPGGKGCSTIERPRGIGWKRAGPHGDRCGGPEQRQRVRRGLSARPSRASNSAIDFAPNRPSRISTGAATRAGAAREATSASGSSAGSRRIRQPSDQTGVSPRTPRALHGDADRAVVRVATQRLDASNRQERLARHVDHASSAKHDNAESGRPNEHGGRAAPDPRRRAARAKPTLKGRPTRSANTSGAAPVRPASVDRREVDRAPVRALNSVQRISPAADVPPAVPSPWPAARRSRAGIHPRTRVRGGLTRSRSSGTADGGVRRIFALGSTPPSRASRPD
jgi:hypothetical protein